MKRLIVLSFFVLLMALQNGKVYPIPGCPTVFFHDIQTEQDRLAPDTPFVVLFMDESEQLTFPSAYLLGLKYMPDSQVM
jgi:hypothetical protein